MEAHYMSHSLASHLAVAFPLGHRGLKSSGVLDPLVPYPFTRPACPPQLLWMLVANGSQLPLLQGLSLFGW